VFEHYANDPGRLFTPEFRAALYNHQLAQAYPELKPHHALHDSSGKLYPPVPMLLLHGAADPIVKAHTIQDFVADLCSQGHTVTYRLYPGIDHFQSRQATFGDTTLWMRQIVEGFQPTSNCSSVATR